MPATPIHSTGTTIRVAPNRGSGRKPRRRGVGCEQARENARTDPRYRVNRKHWHGRHPWQARFTPVVDHERAWTPDVWDAMNEAPTRHELQTEVNYAHDADSE